VRGGHGAGVLFIASFLLSVVAPSRPAMAATRSTGQILYEYDCTIHAVNPDGTGDTALTDGGCDSAPEWSPDRSQIAFISTRDDLNGDIFVMDADGSDQVNLTGWRGAKRDLFPTWSPDGTRIAFCGDTPYTIYSIYIIDLIDGSLTSVGGSTLNCSGVTWSPDGSTIVFSADYGTLHFALYAVNPDGSNFRVLINTGGNDVFPDFSPDGRQIVFERDGNGRAWVMVAGSAGTALKRVSPATALDWFPVWSPDGRQIAFDVHSDIWVMNANGTGRYDIAKDPYHYEDWPDW